VGKYMAGFTHCSAQPEGVMAVARRGVNRQAARFEKRFNFRARDVRGDPAFVAFLFPFNESSGKNFRGQRDRLVNVVQQSLSEVGNLQRAFAAEAIERKEAWILR